MLVWLRDYIYIIFYRCSIKELFLKIYNFQRKHLCKSVFLNIAAGVRPATLWKKTLAQVSFCEFKKNFKNNFFTEHLRTTPSIIYLAVSSPLPSLSFSSKSSSLPLPIDISVCGRALLSSFFSAAFRSNSFQSLKDISFNLFSIACSPSQN